MRLKSCVGLDLNMYTYDLDVHNRCRSASSSASSSQGHCYTTAESVQQANRGFGISAGNKNNSTPRSTLSSQLTMCPTALGSHGSRWLGGGFSDDTRAESRGLAGHPDPRYQLLRKLRSADRKWQRRPEDDCEAWDELTTFLRTVTPPPTNFMSIPTEPYSPTLSYRSSIKRRGSRTSRKKMGPLARCLQFLKGRSKQKKSARRPPSVRASSPPAGRTVSRKQKRPPQIKLPDTAISGRTVDGHRHIAISIPVEHAHLSPQSKDGFHEPSGRTRFLPPVELIPAAPSVRPMSAFANESHVGTHLGSVAEERGSLSSKSRSWTRDSRNGHEDAHDSGIASRHTFGRVEEQVSSRDSGSMSPPRVPRRISDRYDAPSPGRPSTSQTNDDSRDAAHRKALAALSRPQTAPRSVSAVSVQSAYSFRSFATPSPSPRVHHPIRKTSLHFGPPVVDQPQARTASDQRGHNQRSRDSSRDKYTKQESIFSERSFLESIGTADSDSEAESGVITEGMQAMGYPFPAGSVHTATPPTIWFEGQYGNARETGGCSGRGSRRNSDQGNGLTGGQGIRRSSGQTFDKTPIWKRRQREAAVIFNSETKTVEAQSARKSQMRDSVDIVLETPTEASWPNGFSESSGEEDEGGFMDKETEFRGKEKERVTERNPMLTVPGVDTKPPSSLPGFKKRGRRKEVLLSREQKIAKLRQKLETPGIEPKDLVWRRNSSSSSDGISDESRSTDEGTVADHTTPTHSSAIAESIPNSLEAAPGRFSLSAVMTVADVRPSSLRTASPDLDITSPLSTSSSATMANMVKTSSVPQHHSLGSVTSPDSPYSSPTPPSPVSSVEAQPRGTPLQHPPSRRLKSFPRRPSTSFDQAYVPNGTESPIIKEYPTRPRIASNGLPPSYFQSQQYIQGQQYIQEKENAEYSAPHTEPPRGEQLGPYEAQGEDKAQDMERRLTKLERYRDHWMTSMIPLLTDMGQALGKLSTGNGNGKGKEVDCYPQAEGNSGRPNTSNSDGRKNRSWRRGSASETAESNTQTSTRYDPDNPLDRDEVVVHHHPRHVRAGRSRAGTNTSEHSRRLYLLDETPPHPGLDYDDLADDERRARSSSHCEGNRSSNHWDRGRTTSVPLRAGTARPQARARTSSGMGTVDHSSRAGTMASPAPTPALPVRLRKEAGRLERLERHNRRVDAARMRSMSLGGRPAWEMGFGRYAAGADGANGMETLEGLMTELQVLGSRLGMGSVDGGEGEGVREAPPRAVVGFGAFR